MSWLGNGRPHIGRAVQMTILGERTLTAALGLLLAFDLWATFVSSTITAAPPLPGDLRSFVISGKAASAGRDPYATNVSTVRLDPTGRDIEVINLNPPVLLPIFAFLSEENEGQLWLAWRAAS